jgi:acetylornithine/N-succinyldiaminopimelate aminotransferase
LSETNWPEIEARLYMPTFKRAPITIVRGEGLRVWDDKGRSYLDFVAGVAVNSLGHCHPVVVEALQKQAATLIHTSNLYYTIPQLELAALLVEHSCMDRVFFQNSGAEATEGAVKLARRYGKLHLHGAYEVITASDSFHGRTLAMVAASAQPKHQDPYTPLPEGFVNVAWDDADSIANAITDKTCAVMLEPVQGESGVRIPSDHYLRDVREVCDERGVLLIADEVQTGVGRLGALFGYKLSGIEPDVMTLAKGLGSGVPIGAFLCKESASAFKAGDHGSTFAGNPLVCAVGTAVMRYIIENDIPGHVREMGAHLLMRLNEIVAEFPAAHVARGRGLLVALDLNGDIAAKATGLCLEKGLLVNPVRPDTLRFAPPLVVNRQEIDEAVSILRSVLSSV